MNHIWGVILQTCTVTVTAGLILAIKYLLEDKLSPRWQYGVWIILALRLLIPASVNQFSLMPLGLWIETLKGMIEPGMNSAFSQAYIPIQIKYILPIIPEIPTSITDYLFVIYVLGVFLFLLKYITSYVRLRFLLKKGQPVSKQFNQHLQALSTQYSLKTCKVIKLKGITSAFVCGVFQPVLVIPKDEKMDDKILLHELYHLKYQDPLQNWFWTLMRCFHWCNPFLQYVLNRIGNDMESLCDQRVLESLEGEDRRRYGLVLLNMANDQYARAVGTSSISNGGKNISRRIDAIVRFKKYPQGMSLVSICIVFVLAWPLLVSSSYAYETDLFRPVQTEELTQAMALARINRCTTMAGALDTYAKGLIRENGIYLATASPFEKHEALYQEMVYHSTEDDWVAYHVDTYEELDYMDQSQGYQIMGLKESEKGYEGYFIFQVEALLNDDGIGLKVHEQGDHVYGLILIPFVTYEDDGWVVEETGKPMIQENMTFMDAFYDVETSGLNDSVVIAQGESGTVEITTKTSYVVSNTIQNNSWFGTTTFDDTPKVNAEFEYANYSIIARYSIEGNTTGKMPENSAGIMIATLDSTDEEVEWPEIEWIMNSSGSSSGGFNWQIDKVSDSWNGEIISGSGSHDYNVGSGIRELPKAYKVRIMWDGEVIEELIITGEEK